MYCICIDLWLPLIIRGETGTQRIKKKTSLQTNFYNYNFSGINFAVRLILGWQIQVHENAQWLLLYVCYSRSASACLGHSPNPHIRTAKIKELGETFAQKENINLYLQKKKQLYKMWVPSQPYISSIHNLEIYSATSTHIDGNHACQPIDMEFAI